MEQLQETNNQKIIKYLQYNGFIDDNFSLINNLNQKITSIDYDAYMILLYRIIFN